MKLFVLAGLAAGGLNYVFQIVASRNLPLADFAAFGAWFANLAVLFTLPTLLQNTSNFKPCAGRSLRASLILINIGLLLAGALWLVCAPGLGAAKGGLILFAASLFGWLSGQAQIRLHLLVVAAAGLALALFKLLALFWPLTEPLDRLALALFVSYVPVVWFLTVDLWVREAVTTSSRKANPRRWAAPVILSLASATLPQMDLVILHLTLPAEEFARFVLASLFYKAIYFIVVAYLQWLLPHQVLGRARRALGASAFVRFILSTFVLSAGMAIFGPPILSAVLHWADTPPAAWVFLACANTGLLTWLFIQIQADCAQGLVGRAFLLILGLAVESLAQLLLGWSVTPYLCLALVGQGALALWTLRPVGSPEAEVST